jgi:hypothetical protein
LTKRLRSPPVTDLAFIAVGRLPKRSALPGPGGEEGAPLWLTRWIYSCTPSGSNAVTSGSTQYRVRSASCRMCRNYRSRRGVHPCARPRVPLDRGGLQGRATIPSRRWTADPAFHLACNACRLSAGLTPRPRTQPHLTFSANGGCGSEDRRTISSQTIAELLQTSRSSPCSTAVPVSRSGSALL